MTGENSKNLIKDGPIHVAFIGLGVMGFPMAGHLAQAGCSVNVYNRTARRADEWLDHYQNLQSADAPNRLQVCATPKIAAADCQFVFVCVGNDEDVREVCLSDTGVLAGLSEHTTLIDHTTASAELAYEIDHACQMKNVGFLDAPVSGGQAGAENGALTVMLGGHQEEYEKVLPVLNCYAKKTSLLGAVGSGQLAKMVNQICIAGVLQGLAEGLHFAQKAGLDGAQVVEVIAAGAAQSWQMENRYKTMLADEFEFGFAVDWMRKDLDIALTTGKQIDARLPLTALVDQFYADVQAMDGGRWDTSSLLKRLS